jgi:preprotein translocase subunit YajC
MNKKIWLPVFAALLLALAAGAWMYADAAAQEGRFPLARQRKLPGALGQVTAISAGQFTIQTRAGEERTISFDDTTRFIDPQKQPLSADDLQTGGWVAVAIARQGGEPPLARLVVILPEDFDPANMAGLRGRVVGVDVAGDAFTLEDKNGQATTAKVNADTQYRGQVTALADLQVGMLAQAATEEQANGDLLAKTLRAGYPLVKHAGEVVRVDLAAGQFVLKTARTDQELTITVDAETRFRSKDDTVQELADLQTGMVVVVSAEKQGEDALLARLVAAGNKEDLPKFDQRFLGKVTAVDDQSFTIQTRQGQAITFQVTDETRFRSRRGAVDGLEDLKPGMPVAVGAGDLGDGQYQALAVLVAPNLTK